MAEEDNQESSVSSHISMPSLMSDDESIESSDDDDNSEDSDLHQPLLQQIPVLRADELHPPNVNDNLNVEPLADNNNDDVEEPANGNDPPPNMPQAEEFLPQLQEPEDLFRLIVNADNDNFEAMDVAELLNLLQRHSSNRLIRNSRNNNNNNISDSERIQRDRDHTLKRLMTTLYDIIDEINHLCWVNYDDDNNDNEEKTNDETDPDIDMKNDDNNSTHSKQTKHAMYEYVVYNKQCNLMNPSYNILHQTDTRHRRDQDAQIAWDAKQIRVPFKIPHSYPFINVYREYDCMLHHVKDETPSQLCVAQWKMNLLSIDPIHKLLFIASGTRIFVYKLAITDTSAADHYSDPIDIVTIESNINRLQYALLDNKPVVYLLDYDGFIHVMDCKTHRIQCKQSNIIPTEDDNSSWSIGVGAKHNRIGVGSNTHCVQIHNCSPHSEFNPLQLNGHQNNVPCVAYHPNDENKIASASIDGTIRVWDISDRYNIKQKTCDFKAKIDNNNGMEHDSWMWSVCWVINPHFYLHNDDIDYIQHLRDKILNYYQQRCIWNKEIKQIRKALSRRYQPSSDRKEFVIQTVQRLIDIVHNVTKHISDLIGLSSLTQQKKKQFNAEFDARLQQLIHDLTELQSQCSKEQNELSKIDESPSVSTHSSMPSIRTSDDSSDDDDDIQDSFEGFMQEHEMEQDDNNDSSDSTDEIIEMSPPSQEHTQLANSEVAAAAAVMHVMPVAQLVGNEGDYRLEENNDNEELEEFKAMSQNISGMSQRTPPPAQQGFDEMIKYQMESNAAESAPIIGCLTEQKDRNNINDSCMEKEEDSDSCTFHLVSYQNDTDDNVYCDVKTLRIEKEVKDKIISDNHEKDTEDDILMDTDTIPYIHKDIIQFVEIDLTTNEDENQWNALFKHSLCHFEGMRLSVIDMESEMKRNSQKVSEDESPFVGWKFELSTVQLSSQMIHLNAEWLVLYKELVYHQCIDCETEFSDDKPLDIKPNVVQSLIFKIQQCYQMYIESRSLYIQWKKQWNNIEKRKQIILEKSECLKHKKHKRECKDYLVACSRAHIYLINTESMQIVDSIQDIMNEVLDGYTGCHRLEYALYIEELSLLIVSSNACNRFVFVRIVNKYESESEPIMIIEGFYPKRPPFKDNLGCILGMQCVKCSEGMWRLYVLYQIIDDEHHQYRNSGVAVKIVSFLITHHSIEKDVSPITQCLL